MARNIVLLSVANKPIMLNVIMLSVIMLNVIMLNVVAPFLLLGNNQEKIINDIPQFFSLSKLMGGADKGR